MTDSAHEQRSIPTERPSPTPVSGQAQAPRRRATPARQDAEFHGLRHTTLDRDAELEGVLRDLESRCEEISAIGTRDHDDKLAVVEALAAPYALAFLNEIRRLEDMLIPGSGATAKPHGSGRTNIQRAPIPTTPGKQQAEAERRSPGRPLLHDEPWAKITVTILPRHVAYVDRMRLSMRLRHHKSISRTAVIRGLVEFMQRSEIDFSQFGTVEDLVTYLTPHFRELGSRFLAGSTKLIDEMGNVAKVGKP